MTSGIYKYTNKNTGAVYIGSAKDIKTRHKTHLNTLPIDIAIVNEGWDNFTLEILEELPPDSNILLNKEREWIDVYDAVNNPLHYNKAYPLKYNLWNPVTVRYNKGKMFQNGRDGSEPCCCFYAKSPTQSRHMLPIGLFNEYISPQIIYDFCCEELGIEKFKYNN